jgi:hypothetical protein
LFWSEPLWGWKPLKAPTFGGGCLLKATPNCSFHNISSSTSSLVQSSGIIHRDKCNIQKKSLLCVSGGLAGLVEKFYFSNDSLTHPIHSITSPLGNPTWTSHRFISVKTPYLPWLAKTVT